MLNKELYITTESMKHTERLWLLYLFSVFLNFGFSIGNMNFGITCSRSGLCECRTGSDHTMAVCRDSTSIPDDLPTNTKHLEFSFAQFESNTLQRANLSRYSQLEALHFYRCHLEAVDADAFADLSNLKYLTLNSNNIKLIQPNTFSGLELEQLGLSNNSGIEFRVGSFQGLQTKYLILEESALKKLNPEVFRPLKSSLKILLLSSNDLEELPEEMESVFSGLWTLLIKDNPWKCDCKLKWFKKFYDFNKHMFIWAPICASPKELEDKNFDYIEAEDFQCATYS